MPINVQFEGTNHEFPDDFSQEDIKKALVTAHGMQAGGGSATPAAPAARPRTPFDQRPPEQQAQAQRRARHSLSGNEAPRPSAAADAANMIEGTAKYASGAAIPSIMANPVAAVGALAGGTAANYLGDYGSQIMGASPDTSRLIGDVASVPGAMMGESPRLGGYLKGGLESVLPAAWRAGFGHLFVPNPMEILSGAQEGAKGKLWKGESTRTARDLMRGPTAPPPPPMPSLGPTPGQYDAPRYTQPPVETGGAHIPDYQYPIGERQWPGPPPPQPASGSMGTGPQAGFGAGPDTRPPVPTGGGHIPDYQYPIGPVQYPERPVKPAGKTAGAKPGQYDAPKPPSPLVETGGGHVPDYKHPLPGPEETVPRVEARIKAEAEAAKAKAASTGKPSAAPPPPPAPAPISASAAPPLASDLEKSGQVVQTGQIPVRSHETNVKVDKQINNKVQNLAEYLRSKGGTAEHLDQIVQDPALTRQYLDEAHSFGKSKGNPVPKTGYKGLDPGSDSHAAVRQRILDMIEQEKNKQ